MDKIDRLAEKISKSSTIWSDVGGRLVALAAIWGIPFTQEDNLMVAQLLATSLSVLASVGVFRGRIKAKEF